MNTKEKCRVRFDLTDYLTHFIHKRTYGTQKDYICFDKNDNPCYLAPNPLYESGYQLSEGSSFDVLVKILYDGLLRTGWSDRNDSATVYGRRSAVCFTETPLYGLIKYALNRQDAFRVDYYGIAFDRRKMFCYGARPVIYGFSGGPTENPDEFITPAGYRMLNAQKHLPLCEQYRFVKTEIYSDTSNDIDWMHEREWRWPLKVNEDDGTPLYPEVPGLPIYGFDNVVIIVKTSQEKECIGKILQKFYDDPKWRFDSFRKNIIKWRMIATDDLWLDDPEYRYENKRIEDIDNTIFGRIIP